jgi:hypothetical protein
MMINSRAEALHKGGSVVEWEFHEQNQLPEVEALYDARHARKGECS